MSNISKIQISSRKGKTQAAPQETIKVPTGAAFTTTYERRTTANWIDFLGRVESWIEPGAERVFAVVDNLNIHGGMDVLLFALAHPRWEFVFQPKYAAYLNLIEPWWKVLRSLALAGRRFETWDELGFGCARRSWRGPAGESPAQVRGSARL